MAEKKPSELSKVFDRIDSIRLSIKNKAEDRYKRIVEHRNQTAQKQQDKIICDKLKQEFIGLLSDKRYADYLQFHILAEKLLTEELKNAVIRGSIDGLNMEVIKIAGILEYIDLVKSKDKRMKDFLRKLTDNNE